MLSKIICIKRKSVGDIINIPRIDRIICLAKNSCESLVIVRKFQFTFKNYDFYTIAISHHYDLKIVNNTASYLIEELDEN